MMKYTWRTVGFGGKGVEVQMAQIKSVAAVGLALVWGASAVVAHVDDPKERDKQKPYVGPGYKSAEGGIAGPPLSFPSENVQLLAWLPLGEFNPANTSAATVEGYVSPSGREYAIVGTSHVTGFVEVSNPGNPVIVETLPGPVSLWKDVRVYQDRAFSVSEGGSGIQVFNLSQIDNGTVTHVGDFNTPAGTSAATHTMFINPASGRLYRAGGSGNGLRIYSLANPDNPVFLGAWPDRYVHEVTVVSYTEGQYAGKEIAFCCGGFNSGYSEPGLYIVDITNLLDGNPNNGDPLLSYTTYFGASYCHQGWLSEDKQYFYLDDELDEPEIASLTRIINISNLSAPTNAGSFTSGASSVDHNLYVKGNLIFESNYRSGLRVFDATDPINPEQIAFFDTYPQDDNPNFNSLWDNYPYLPSGIVLGSDIEKGFFIWHVGPLSLTFAYPDGQPNLLNPDGDTVAVSITAAGDEVLLAGSPTLHVNSGAGWIESSMQPLGENLFNAVFPMAPCGSAVQWYVSAQTESGLTVNDPLAAPGSTYTASAAFGETNGFFDTMEGNLGWTANGAGDTAVSGQWVRVDPNGTLAQPENDHSPIGTLCWVTGQGAVGGGLSDADVDGGYTTLVSPTLVANQNSPAYIEYYRWYSNNTGSDPNNDSMPIQISNNNGASWVTLETVTENTGQWVRKSFEISDFVTPTNQIKVRFIAQDLGTASVVEAGVDDVRIVYYDCDGTQNRYVKAQANVSGAPPSGQTINAVGLGLFNNTANASASSGGNTASGTASQNSTTNGLVMSGTGSANINASGSFQFGPGSSSSASHFEIFFHIDAPTLVRLTGTLTADNNGAGAMPSAQVSLNGPGVSILKTVPILPNAPTSTSFNQVAQLVQGDYTILARAAGTFSAPPLQPSTFSQSTFQFNFGPSVAGDVTGDGSIDVDDLLAVINAWGSCPGCPADLTGDGVVDVDDLLQVVNNWT